MLDDKDHEEDHFSTLGFFRGAKNTQTTFGSAERFWGSFADITTLKTESNMIQELKIYWFDIA